MRRVLLAILVIALLPTPASADNTVAEAVDTVTDAPQNCPPRCTGTVVDDVVFACPPRCVGVPAEP